MSGKSYFKYLLPTDKYDSLIGEDFTFFEKISEFRSKLSGPENQEDSSSSATITNLLRLTETDSRDSERTSGDFSFSGTIDLVLKEDSQPDETYKARALICRCYAGEYVSISVRLERKLKYSRVASQIPVHGDQTKELTSRYHSPPQKAGEGPKNTDEKRPETAAFPVPLDFMFNYVLQSLGLSSTSPLHGGLLITGPTGSGKSQLARAIIHALTEADLKRSQVGSRRPHIITVEDPIEKLMFDDGQAAITAGVDYTPREINADCKCVTDALTDALRQKPSIVFLGELRLVEDLKHMVEFAKTGHLVIATAHAGSLIESMSKLVEATNSKSPSDRGHLAQSLLGVVNLVPWSKPVNARRYTVMLPSVWKRTMGSVADFVSDGLASLIPQNAAHAPWPSTVGKFNFVQHLRRPHLGTSPSFFQQPEICLSENLVDLLSRDAMQLDLDGA